MKAKLLFILFFVCIFFTLNSQNLVAYFPFNNNANDESGNGNHGTVYGATITTDRFGNTNSAYSFDGVDDYISIANNPNINIQTGESFTISFWLKHNAQNNAKYMISKYKGSFGEPSYAFGTGSYGDSYSWHEFTANNGIESRGNIDLNDNQWHNITSVFKSGESVTIYVDGVLDIEHSTTHVGSIINSRDLTIGCGSNLAQFYNGSIDDIKIYNKALTTEEIKNEYKSLVAYYPFNGTAEDKSGNGHDGTLFGPVLTSDKDGNAESAYYFDGSNDYIDLGDWENGGAMTFTFWARWDAFNNYSRIIDLGNGSSSNNIIIANHQTNNGLFFSTYVSGETKLITANTITQSQWDFYAATFNINGLITVYKNGNQINQKTDGIAPNLLLRTEQFIGKSNFSADGYFKGAIDELRIYQTTLSDAEILNLYTYNTLKVDKIEDVANSKFYVHNNVLHFKNTQNLAEIKSVEVYNLLSQNIFKTSKIEKDIQLNSLQKGMYVLKVENAFGNYSTLKFIIN